MGIFFDPSDSTYIVTACDHQHRIKTTVTAVPFEASRWIDETLRIHGSRPENLIVALEIKVRPRGLYGASVHDPATTIQLGVDDRCLIFQLLYCPYIPDKLSDFLEDDRFHFVGVAVEAYARRLQHDYDLNMRGHLHDLRELAAEKCGMPQMKHYWLPGLVRDILGLSLNNSAPVCLSDWGRLQLQEDQIEYATINLYATYQVAWRLLGDNF